MDTSDDLYPLLSTRRLLLRAPVIDDVPVLQEIGNNRALARMVASIPHPFTIEAAHEWVEKTRLMLGQSPHVSLVIARRDQPQIPIGTCDASLDDKKSIYQLGYWIGEEHWGNGYATEAVKELVYYLIKEKAATRITAWHADDNSVARKVLQKNGFRDTGVQGPVHSVGRGRYVPCTLMERSC